MGNTAPISSLPHWTAVHPHARGEHEERLNRLSPVHRFIPTHVGNTAGSAARGGVIPVHPHARGEHKRFTRSVEVSDGSSPRTWGTRMPIVSDTASDRFIPTHVGNTSLPRTRLSSLPVHPHARGEHNCSRTMSSRHDGSSPRTWGTPDPAAWPRIVRRFIPTHVGNTLFALVCPYRQRFIPTHVGNT